MPKIPIQAFYISILGLAVGCGSTGPDGSASSGSLEDVPRGADECKGPDCGDPPDDDRCLDWYVGDECHFECPSPPEGDIVVFEDDCGQIHVSSCKDLSNVVLLCCEDDTCEEHKIDNLHEQRLSLEPLEDWDCELVGLCVKAGDNAGSGVCDGPGYGEHISRDDFEPVDIDCDGAGGNGGDGGGGGGATGGDGGSGGTGGTGGEVLVQ